MKFYVMFVKDLNFVIKDLSLVNQIQTEHLLILLIFECPAKKVAKKEPILTASIFDFLDVTL